MKLVVCESTAAVVPHAREVTDLTPVQFHGHTRPKPLTLCGTEAAWDTELPLPAVRCRTCLAKMQEHKP